jgi:hypothetical protein
MARNPLAQFALTAVAGVLAATLISQQGAEVAVPSPAMGGTLEPAVSPLPFRAEFVGVALDGESLEWRMASNGESPQLLLRVRPLATYRAAEPQWSVGARLEAAGGLGSRALVAELAGMLDWRVGALRLESAAATGAAAGDRVRIDARLIDLDLRGVVLIDNAGRVALRTPVR